MRLRRPNAADAARNDSVLIRKDGKPVAALIDARLFERIQRMQERFDALCDRLEQTYTGATEAEALAEIERATTRARASLAGLRDPDDLPVLALLIGSGADHLVTGDKDLLALANAYPILTPASFVHRFVP